MSAGDKFNKHTTAQEVVDAFPENIKGRFIVVTGASPGGLGYETARAIATKDPKLLVLAGRDQEKLDAARADIAKESRNVKVETVILDLESLDSVRQAAKDIATLGNPDVLINNAAVMACPYATTKDGYEYQFGVNYVASWLLTNLLLPSILKTSHPRVVFVASSAHLRSDIRWDDIDFSEGKTYDKQISYGQSKTAMILGCLALADKYGDQGLTTISLHPGGIMTNLSRHLTLDDLQQYKHLLNDDLTPNLDTGIWKTIPEGSSTTLTAAFDPRMSKLNGAYLTDCQVARDLDESDGPADMATFMTKVTPYAKDPASAKRLWDLTNKMLGTDF